MLKSDTSAFATKLSLTTAKISETAGSKVFTASTGNRNVIFRPTKLVRNRTLSNSGSSAEAVAVSVVSPESIDIPSVLKDDNSLAEKEKVRINTFVNFITVNTMNIWNINVALIHFCRL